MLLSVCDGNQLDNKFRTNWSIIHLKMKLWSCNQFYCLCAVTICNIFDLCDNLFIILRWKLSLLLLFIMVSVSLQHPWPLKSLEISIQCHRCQAYMADDLGWLDQDFLFLMNHHMPPNSRYWFVDLVAKKTQVLSAEHREIDWQSWLASDC